MNFADRFNYPTWNLIGWVVINALWLGWEIWGATHENAATFTYLLRSVCASFKYGRMCLAIAWLVLGWHFLFYDTQWFKSLLVWLRRG